MSQPTHPLLSLVECNANGLKSMLTSYIDATVDNQFASLKSCIFEMINNGQICPQYSENVLAYTMFPTGQSSIEPENSSILYHSNDHLITHQQITLPSSSLVSTITTSPLIKQECLDTSSTTIPINVHFNNAPNDDDQSINVSSLNEGPNEQALIDDLKEEYDDDDDPSLHNQSTNLINEGIPQPSTSSHFNSQFVNMNYPHHQPNGPIHLDSISNLQLSQSQFMSINIKKEIETTTNEPMSTHQVQSCSYAPVSNELSKHNLPDKNWNDNDECVDGGIGVKEEDEEDQMDRELSRPVKKPRIDPIQPNNVQPDVTRQRQPTDEAQSNEDRPNGDGERMESEQSEAIDTRGVIGEYSQHNSDESMVIQQEERDANNAIGEEIATACTTNPIQPNRHLQCSHCHKSFNCNTNLQTHLRVHTGERPFECDQCDKRFSVKGNLTKHQLIHQNIKSFRCSQCDKQFTQKQSLDTYLITHSGERPFQCRHCEMSFITSNNRKMHEQAIHLHVKPYRCKQCGHIATQRSDVITHIRMIHFRLPRTAKEQRALNIIDDRDPKELVEKV